jgi:hypothetical protein
MFLRINPGEITPSRIKYGSYINICYNLFSGFDMPSTLHRGLSFFKDGSIRGGEGNL